MTYRNLMLTMAIGGLWHGAAWNFVAWGVLHGTALCIERFVVLRRSVRLPAAVGWALTIMVVVLGWVPHDQVVSRLLQRKRTTETPV